MDTVFANLILNGPSIFSSSEGLRIGSEHPISFREGKVLELLKAALNFQPVLVTAPPRSGKSSLLQLTCQFLLSLKKKPTVKMVSGLFLENGVPFLETLKKRDPDFMKILESDTAYVFIDDAQKTYHDIDFWNAIKYSKCYIFAFGSYGSSNLGDMSTPFAFKRRFFSKFLLADPVEVMEIFNDYKAHAEPQSPVFSDSAIGFMSRLSDFHLPDLKEMIMFVYESVRKSSVAIVGDEGIFNLLFTEKFLNRIRSTRSFVDLYRFSSMQKSCLLQVLSTTNLVVKDLTTDWVHLIKTGILIRDDDEGVISFFSPSLRSAYLRSFHLSHQTATENPTSILQFIKDCLTMMRPALLKNSFSKRAGLTALKEAAWQGEFFTVASSMLHHSANVSFEVSRVFLDSPKKDSLDFYVNSNLQWMIEFVSEGNNVEEHINRFSPTGKYSHLPRSDWLVVYFTTMMPSLKEWTKNERLLQVFYSIDTVDTFHLHQWSIEKQEILVTTLNPIGSMPKSHATECLRPMP